MDNKKLEDLQQQAPPQYEDVQATRALIDEVCEDATLKGAVLIMILTKSSRINVS